MRRVRLNSIKHRLLLLFFAITAAAVGFVYLYVVPQLESSLTAQKLRRLEEVARDRGPRVARAVEERASPAALQDVVERTARRADARLTVVAVDTSGDDPEPSFVLADSESDVTARLPRYEAAAASVRLGGRSSAIESVAGARVAETAVPIAETPRASVVAVFSAPLVDVGDNVGLIRRQIVIAGAIALVAALIAGYWAASAIATRLRRIERAAGEVARGHFGAPIPVDSSDELGQLAEAFNEMQSRLARLDDARKDFIANASHELRTPIFSLGGFVELLEDEDLDESTREEFVGLMREQVERLRKLTGDLLDLSRLDADALELRRERVPLDDLAASVVAEFGPAASRHGSAVELRASPKAEADALGDPIRIAQILRILLDNAIGHTPKGTPVTVTTHSSNGIAEVIVSDAGPGIDRRSLGRVFDRFHTGDSAGGSGLGLAIARELAVLMEGRLDVASKAGFTAFTLELPAAGPADGEPPVVREARW